MKLYQPKYKRQPGPSVFSGKVKVTVTGIDQTSRLMSKQQGLPAKAFVVQDTTVEEVYAAVYEAIRRLCMESSEQEEAQ